MIAGEKLHRNSTETKLGPQPWNAKQSQIASSIGTQNEMAHGPAPVSHDFCPALDCSTMR